MDYESYNNDTDPSDDDYFAFVTWLSERTALELRQAQGDPEQQKQALIRYYRQGEQSNLTAGELIDFLCVSIPSILEMAGYTDEQSDAVMRISNGITDTERDEHRAAEQP